MVNIEQAVARKELYIQFRESFMTQMADFRLPDNVKKEFEPNIRSRRCFHRISSYALLIQELEKQLFIFPEQGRVHAYKLILQRSQPSRPSLEKELNLLTQRLQPPRQPPQQPLPLASHKVPVPEKIIQLMARTFEEEEKGRDWEHFATGLGWNRSDRELIRLLQGEVDRIEEQHATTSERLREVLVQFHAKCLQAQAQFDLVQHIVAVCGERHIFGTPYRMLARQIGELARDA